MNENYIYEYSDLLERILSCGVHFKVSEDHLEKMISKSIFFQEVEKSGDGFAPIIIDVELINSIFVNNKFNLNDVPVYTMCLWASESYMRIQHHTGLTFEAVFLYMPLQDMYSNFNLYHEMDFSQIINLFQKKYSEQTILEILIDRFGYKLNEVSEITQIPYETIRSLKLRRRDFKKTNIEIVYKLASLFKVRVETIAELQVKELF